MSLKKEIEKFDKLHPESQNVDYTDNLFASVDKLENRIYGKDTIINNLEEEILELKNQISILQKEKSNILGELKESGWLENKVTLSSKYKGNVKTILGEVKVIDTKIIPLLTTVGRKKQGGRKLDFKSWLLIPENRYLYEMNESIAKDVYNATTEYIRRNFEDRKISRGGGVVTQENYALSFSGDRSGATETFVSTNFNPDTYSLWNGFTISFWVRPDEAMNQKSVILGTRASSPVARFHFGLSGVGTNIGVGVGGNDITGINNPMEIGRWYNWVISYTGTQFDAGERKLRMWINTDARMTNNNSTSWGNQDEATDSYTHGIYFGGRNTEGSGYTNGFACALDEVAIYNECKDSVGTFASEVYNGGTKYDHTKNSNLVGYWKFNEGSGTTVIDHSTNSNNGTLTTNDTGLPTWVEVTDYS
jgi:hypothetical protein